jgi:hypothetical protein
LGSSWTASASQSEELYRENLCKNINQIDADTRWALVATRLGIEGDLKNIIK